MLRYVVCGIVFPLGVGMCFMVVARKNLLLRCPRGLAMLHYKASPPYFPPRVNWISADKIPEPPLYTTSMKPVPKLWYYDPEPCSKYKSYYPYLGQVICRDTIIVPTKYLWE